MDTGQLTTQTLGATESRNPAPRILALSGAAEMLLTTLCEGETCLSYRAHKQGFQHNEQIVSLCDQLFREAELELGQLDAIAIDLGPGSFTGQRISMSFAKGLSAATGKPLLGFSTFELWRELFRTQQSCHCSKIAPPLLVLIDGRKRRFYASLYIAGQSVDCWDLSSRDLCLNIVEKWGIELIAELSLNGPGAALFLEELAGLAATGEAGAAAQQRALQAWQSCHFCSLPDTVELTNQMLQLARREYAAGNFLRPSAGPLYLRKSDAEEQAKVKGTSKSTNSALSGSGQ